MIDFDLFDVFYSLVMNEDLDKGSQLPYIRRALELGYSVMLLNTNHNFDKGTLIPVLFTLLFFIKEKNFILYLQESNFPIYFTSFSSSSFRLVITSKKVITIYIVKILDIELFR